MSAAAAAGERLEQYEILRELGSGAAGAAYYARDTRLLRPVVLKILHRDAADDAARSEMVEEARLASAIDHPNVCSIYEIRQDAERPFIAMQFVPGRTLETLIAEGPLNLHLATSIAIQIASGLVEAHRLGIVHRDLKPANVMITDGGMVKILDFGLARRRGSGDEATGPEPASESLQATSPLGTVAYLAPEQFVTRKSTEQSDIYALGVILYEMVTGRHPFRVAGLDSPQLPRAVQYSAPQPPGAVRADLPPGIESILLHAMAKQPANRYLSAEELRDDLRTLVKEHFELGLIPGEASAVLAAPAPNRRGRPWSILVEWFLSRRNRRVAANSVAVMPFRDLEGHSDSRFFGVALGDAIATRLARLTSVVAYPASTQLSLSDRALDPIRAARLLLAENALTGHYSRGDDGFSLSWQLLRVGSGAVRAGGRFTVASLDLVSAQKEIADGVAAALQVSGELQEPALEADASPSLPDIVSEEYLEARALLSSVPLRTSPRRDLDLAMRKLSAVTTGAPAFAPAHAALGVAELAYFSYGFGGTDHVDLARKRLDTALDLDPGLVEAHLHRAYARLWSNEKEGSRQDIQRLLRSSADDAGVHLAAAVILQLDGMVEQALRSLGLALRLNPTAATRVYNHRARLHLQLGQSDLALQELNKGLALEERHPLLRVSMGCWRLRTGDPDGAVADLEAVVAEEPGLRSARILLASCYCVVGSPERAADLMTAETLEAAAGDCEMAYRVATSFAVGGRTSEALHWLRNAIYLGNENYPWLATNPLWADLRDNSDLQRILSELQATFRRNGALWQRLLTSLEGSGGRD